LNQPGKEDKPISRLNGWPRRFSSTTKAALQKPKSLFMAAIVAAMSTDAKIGTILSRNISAFPEPLGDIATSPSATF